MKVLLIGCGNFAKVGHLPGITTFINETHTPVTLYIADPNQKVENARPSPPIVTDDRWFTRLNGDASEEDWCQAVSSQHRQHQFDACIISTRPRYHKVYAKWALSEKLHVLVDKPLTFPDRAHVDISPAQQIVTDYEELINAKSKDVLFLVGTQKRYQVVYRDLGRIIRRVYNQTGCPVTNVVCCTGDGWWLLPEEYGQYSYRRGGKLIHTGYHYLDIVPWLIRHAVPDTDDRITHAWVVASVLRPSDATITYGNTAARKLFDRSTNSAANYDGLGDINSNLLVKLCDSKNRQRASILYSLLHEGFSRRLRDDKDTGGGRNKIDYLAVTQGPVLWAELRRIAKMGREGDNLGGPAHQELTVLCNEQLTPLGDQATLTVKSYPLYASSNESVSASCENDEAPTIDFLKQVDAKLKGTSVRPPSLSPIEDHEIAVRLLSAAYESAAESDRADGKPIATEVRFQSWDTPPGI
ncbi:MAG TPA: Gfo/Idh/MocA family oxidoreductase [Chthonomonadaceae bacterium]|nr:Gfo/Idh/MocA family oxidoreductase [Chthonomonadaceae bacterium]